MKKKAGKIFLVLFSAAISAFATFVLYSLAADYVNSHYLLDLSEYQGGEFLYSLLTLYTPITLMILVFVLIFLLVKKMTIKYPKLIVGAFIFIVFGINFVFKPLKIYGGDVGPYKEGQTVLSFSNLGTVKLHDVVVFRETGSVIDRVALVTGVPGETIENAYYLSQVKLKTDKIPQGFYSVRFGKSDHSWIVSGEIIKYIVWYPFK